jgi:hypothetical protein
MMNHYYCNGTLKKMMDSTASDSLGNYHMAGDIYESGALIILKVFMVFLSSYIQKPIAGGTSNWDKIFFQRMP